MSFWEQVRGIIDAIAVGYAGAICYVGAVVAVFYVIVWYQRRGR